VADWFDERTFHADDFDLDDLAQRKAELGVSVSVVLPARNEADTVAGMVRLRASRGHARRRARRRGRRLHGRDRRARGRSRGARPHRQPDPAGARPAAGQGRRAVAQPVGHLRRHRRLRRQRHPQPRPALRVGLLAPLLTTPDIAFVKAFYDRPMSLGRELHAPPAGARHRAHGPPAAQPVLAGALRRHPAAVRRVRGAADAARVHPVLHRLRGGARLLIDTLMARSVDAIAQVDLARAACIATRRWTRCRACRTGSCRSRRPAWRRRDGQMPCPRRPLHAVRTDRRALPTAALDRGGHRATTARIADARS
jgi:glucosyl-3-phosphoglycerate synthase